MNQYFKEQDGWLAIVDCSDWFDFKFKIREIAHDPEEKSKKCLYRGQGCSSWGLTPSFERKFPGKSPADLDAIYLRRMELFKTNLAIYGNIAGDSRGIKLPAGDEDQDHTVEALAQHYGLSTRLLDWSSSVYVAGFFAFGGAQSSSTGMVSVWALEEAAFEAFSTDHLEHLKDFYDQNVRNLWQMGSFSRNRTTIRDLEDLFRKDSKHCNVGEGDEPKLFRFDIPVSSAKEALSDLAMMRISSMTIFPGIEGVVKWIEDGS